MDKFTDDQIRELHEAFLLNDKDNCGFIKSTEIRDTLKMLGMNPKDIDIQRISIACDDDADSLISFKEFIQMISQLESEEKSTREGKDLFLLKLYVVICLFIIPAVLTMFTCSI